MKKIVLVLLFLCLCGCSSDSGFKTISASEAKQMMSGNVVIIDVREIDEYNEGHIKNAVLIPLGSIETSHDLPNKNEILLIYCRSGRRSKEAADKFVSLGYKKVFNFGGIIDWPYEIVR